MPELNSMKKDEVKEGVAGEVFDQDEKLPPDSSSVSALTPGITLMVGLSLFGCLAIYLLRLDRVVGIFVDDAWYAVLAKALATGQGYTLISSPTAGMLPLYPPAYPFFLSLAYRLAPNFPENLWLLKVVSIAAMMGTGFIAFRYFSGVRNLSPAEALGIAVAAMLAPPLVFLATSTLMSGCFFTLAMLLTVWLVERCRDSAPASQGRWAALAGLAASLAFLTRSIAVGLIAAAFLYLLKEKLLVAAAVFTVTVALLCGPWVLYSNMHASAAPNERQGHIQQPYAKQFWQRMAGDTAAGEETWRDLPGRVGRNVLRIVRIDLARALAAPVVEVVFGQVDQGPAEDASTQPLGLWLMSLLLTGLVLAGFARACAERVTVAEFLIPCLLLVVVLWPWPSFRLILPLLPFWFFYLFKGLQLGVHRMLRRPLADPTSWLVQAALALFVLIGLFGNLNYVLRQSSNSVIAGTGLPDMFSELETQFNFLKQQLKPGEVVASTNPPLTYLFTAHHAVGAGVVTQSDPLAKQLGIRFLSNANLYERVENPERAGYQAVFRSRRYPDQIWVVAVRP